MATASNVATSVDVLSKDERHIIVRALETLLQSRLRASRTVDDVAIAEIHKKAVIDIEALIVKFR